MDDEIRAANRKAREERKRSVLEAMRAGYVVQFRSLEEEPPRVVAERVHDTLERVLERDRAKDRTSRSIQCGKGCDHCCKVPVEIFPQEAALLVRAAREAGIELDLPRLVRQSGYSIETWREQPARDKACVFLDEGGACKVYAHRPNACRKLLVLSEPQFCDDDKFGASRAERWISWEAEVLGSAALEVFGARLMPQALLAALR